MLSIFISLYILCIGPIFALLTPRSSMRRMTVMMSTNQQQSVSVVRNFVTSNFGLVDPESLSDQFQFIFRSKSVPKDKYLSIFAKENSALRRAVPDFEYRPYGFQVDEFNPDLVWFKVRPVGTITGPFSFKVCEGIVHDMCVRYICMLCGIIYCVPLFYSMHISRRAKCICPTRRASSSRFSSSQPSYQRERWRS